MYIIVCSSIPSFVKFFNKYFKILTCLQNGFFENLIHLFQISPILTSALCLGIVLISAIFLNNVTFATVSSMQGFIAMIGGKISCR